MSALSPLNDFHPAAVNHMLATIRACPTLPAWGEYFDGPEMRHSVRVTIFPNERYDVTVYDPPDFTDPNRPKLPPVNVAASDWLQENSHWPSPSESVSPSVQNLPASRSPSASVSPSAQRPDAAKKPVKEPPQMSLF